MALIRGFFFDLDGTLVNTYEADFRAYRDAIEEVTEIRIEHKAFMKTNGQEMRKKLDSLAPGLSEDAIQRIAAGKKKHYAKYLHLTTPNDGLIQFLHAAARDQTMVLVTTAKKQNAQLVLRAHNIEPCFSLCVYGDEVEHSKPHPQSYLIALEKTGLHPQEVIAFEDSAAGIEAAQAAGISVVRVRKFA